MPNVKGKHYRRKGGGTFPRLLTVKEFAHHIQKSPLWVRQACKEGRILACQLVGQNWVIAEDTLIRPRHLKGMPNELLDFDLPLEMLRGDPLYVEKPEYTPRKGNFEAGSKGMKAPGFKAVRRRLGLSQYKIYELTGVSRETQSKMEKGLLVHPGTLLKVSDGLDIGVEELLRVER